MSNELVSIIITAFNEERYIERAITSALNQSYDNIEVIVIDDGSNDKTLVLAEQFMPKVTIFHNESPTGLMEARNLGVRNAKGEYIMFLDGDDEYHTKKVEVQLNAMLKLPEKSMLFTGRTVYSEMGIPMIHMLADLSGCIKSFGYNDVLQKKVTSLGATFMVKREEYLELGCMDPEVGKERDFIARYSFSGGQLFRLYMPLYIQHRKPGSMSTQTEKTYQREIKMLTAWKFSETRDKNRSINTDEYMAYEESVEKNYRKQFAANMDDSRVDEAFKVSFVKRLFMYLVQAVKVGIKNIAGIITYIFFKIREKSTICATIDIESK